MLQLYKLTKPDLSVINEAEFAKKIKGRQIYALLWNSIIARHSFQEIKNHLKRWFFCGDGEE